MVTPRGQGRDLLGAGPFEEEHPHPSRRRRLTDRQRAMVPQQHQGLVAQICDQTFALIVVQRQPLIAVIGHLML